MTIKQIESIITPFGYLVNNMIPLSEVQSIILSTDENVYLDKTTKVKFDNTNGELLLIYDKNEEFQAAISMNEVIGLIMKSNKYREAPYQIGRTL